MPFVAPWLRPTDVLGSIRAGASLGLSLRAQDQAAEEAQANREAHAKLAADALKERSLMSAMRLMEMASEHALAAGYHKEATEARKAADLLRDRHATVMERIAQQNADTSQQRADDLFLKGLSGSDFDPTKTQIVNDPRTGSPMGVSVPRGPASATFVRDRLPTATRLDPSIHAKRAAELLTDYQNTKDQWLQAKEGSPEQGMLEDRLVVLARGLQQPSTLTLPPPPNTGAGLTIRGVRLKQEQGKEDESLLEDDSENGEE